MAITTNELIGATKKKIGNVIFYRSLGKNIIRSKPISINKSNSEILLQAQSRFKTIQKESSNLQPCLINSLNETKGYIAGYNYYISENINKIDQNTNYYKESEKLNITIASGTLSSPLISSNNFAFPILQINYNNSPAYPNDTINDNLNIVTYNFINKKTAFYKNVSTRVEGTLSINLTNSFQTIQTQLIIYLFFTNSSAKASLPTILTL